MEIVIEGSRSSRESWLLAHKLKADDVPALSPAQKRVVAQLRISEEVYARNVLAGRLSSGELKDTAKTLGEWIERELRKDFPAIEVLEVRLITFEGVFRIRLRTPDRTLSLQIEEDVVDRFFSTGSESAEAQLRRILEIYLPRNLAS